MTEEQYEELEDYADEQKEEIAEELSEGLLIPGDQGDDIQNLLFDIN